jgi:hypothetical protein
MFGSWRLVSSVSDIKNGIPVIAIGGKKDGHILPGRAISQITRRDFRRCWAYSELAQRIGIKMELANVRSNTFIGGDYAF